MHSYITQSLYINNYQPVSNSIIIYRFNLVVAVVVAVVELEYRGRFSRIIYKGNIVINHHIINMMID